MLPDVREPIQECGHKNVKLDPHKSCVTCRVRVWGLNGLCRGQLRCREFAHVANEAILDKAHKAAKRAKQRRDARQRKLLAERRANQSGTTVSLGDVGDLSHGDFSVGSDPPQAQSTPKEADVDTDLFSESEDLPEGTGLPQLNLSLLNKMLDGEVDLSESSGPTHAHLDQPPNLAGFGTR